MTNSIKRVGNWNGFNRPGLTEFSQQSAVTSKYIYIYIYIYSPVGRFLKVNRNSVSWLMSRLGVNYTGGRRYTRRRFFANPQRRLTRFLTLSFLRRTASGQIEWHERLHSLPRARSNDSARVAHFPRTVSRLRGPGVSQLSTRRWTIPYTYCVKRRRAARPFQVRGLLLLLLLHVPMEIMKWQNSFLFSLRNRCK